MAANTVGTARRDVAGITVGTESSNVIALAIQAQDILGNSISRSVEVVVTVYESTMIEALANAFTMAVGSAGTLVSDSAQARVIAATDAAGLLDLDLTDVATGSGKTVQVIVQVLDDLTAQTHGATTRATAIFD